MAERAWIPRPGPALVMTAEIADMPACRASAALSGLTAGSPAAAAHRGTRIPCSVGTGNAPPARSTSGAAPRLASLPLHGCAVQRHAPAVLGDGGSHYVCGYGEAHAV